MALHADLTREIDEGPAGPAVGAFFDVDGTLIAGFSAVAFLRDRLASGRMRARDLADAILSTARFQLGRLGFSGLIAATAAWLRDVPEQELESWPSASSRARWRADLPRVARAGAGPPASRPHARHRLLGHPLPDRAIARELGIPNVLCTRLEVQNGRLTGRHLWPTVYGGGKAMAARTLARERGIDLGQSFFYTDSHEDLPLLEIVGRPRPTNPNRRLAAIAALRGWPARRFTTRGTPGLTDVVRSSLALARSCPRSSWAPCRGCSTGAGATW